METTEAITPFLFLSKKEAQEKKSSLPFRHELFSLAEFFKVFGDQTRMRILFFLQKGELCVGDLAALLDMTPSAVSHQLRQLKNAKLVRYRREGKILFYALADEHVQDLTTIGLEHIRE